MSSDRTVATDALATLGTIISANEKRDAIHLAVEPAKSVTYLKPGQHIGFVTGGFGISDNPVGIVDPFLKENVRPGEYFWLYVYPRQITSLRHVWEHPSFPAAEVYSESVDSELVTKILEDKYKANSKAISEEWIRGCAESIDVPYDALIEAISEHDGDKYLIMGTDAYGDIPDELWNHAEILLGKKFNNRAIYFSCSC